MASFDCEVDTLGGKYWPDPGTQPVAGLVSNSIQIEALGNGRKVGRVSVYMGENLPGDLVKCLVLGICDFKLYYEQPH